MFCYSCVEPLKTIDQISRSHTSKDATAALRDLADAKRLHETAREITPFTGDTLLHLAIKNNNADVLQAIIQALGPHAAHAAKISNNNGYTPLDLADLLSDSPEKTRILALLLPIALDCSIRPLTELLNSDEVLQKYPETKTNPVLGNNLRLACAAINEARKQIHHSTSHPQANTYPSDEFNAVNAKLEKFKTTNAGNSLHIHDVAKMISSLGIANCGEFSNLTISHLLNLAKGEPHRIERMKFHTPGNHVFIVMDRDAKSDLDNPATWGPHAVIIDTWSGATYPARAVGTNLMSFYQHEYKGRNSNLLCSYNRHFHRLHVAKEYNSDPTRCSDFTYQFPAKKHVTSVPVGLFKSPAVTIAPSATAAATLRA
jgi:hypothetical protein